MIMYFLWHTHTHAHTHTYTHTHTHTHTHTQMFKLPFWCENVLFFLSEEKRGKFNQIKKVRIEWNKQNTRFCLRTQTSCLSPVHMTMFQTMIRANLPQTNITGLESRGSLQDFFIWGWDGALFPQHQSEGNIQRRMRIFRKIIFVRFYHEQRVERRVSPCYQHLSPVLVLPLQRGDRRRDRRSRSAFCGFISILTEHEADKRSLSKSK